DQGTYYLRYKNAAGKTQHQKLGTTKDISLAGARRRAKTQRAEIQLGADPRGEERARRAAMTLDAFFTGHYLPYVQPRKRSWQRDVELFRRGRAALGGKRLTEITRQQAQALHTAVL